MEASKITKILYSIGLVVFVFEYLVLSLNATYIFAQLLTENTRNLHPFFETFVINPIIGIIAIFVSILVIYLSVKRLAGVVKGNITLSIEATNIKTIRLRFIGITLILLGLLTKLGILLSIFLFATRDYAEMANMLSSLIPVGFIIFELSRLSEFEKLHA